MLSFKKAERKQTKLKLAITGPSGSGKTYSSLLLAKGMGGKIAVIDTENGSASLYSDRFDFDVVEISPPYTIQKYSDAIKAAMSGGYDVLLIDSITHAWAGDGGLLSQKEALDARGGNSYTNWAGITKQQEQFKSTILNANIHMICTMRSKQDYVLVENEKGKQVPKKIGLAPIQRDGMEYEFTTVFDLDMKHNAEASKDRTSLFDLKLFQITEETGRTLLSWLQEGKENIVVSNDLEQDRIAILYEISEVVKSKKIDPKEVTDLIKIEFGLQKTKDLNLEQLKYLLASLKKESLFEEFNKTTINSEVKQA